MRNALIAVALGMILGWPSLPLRAAGPAPESRSATYLVLELDGAEVGYLESFQLRSADTAYLVDKVGLTKDIGSLQAQEIVLHLGAGMSKPMYDWIKASVGGGGGGGGGARKSGAIICADYNYKELSRVTFQNALITEVGMPKLDAASSSPAVMTVTIQPESTSRTFPKKSYQVGERKQKAWLCSNFRLEIGRLPLTTDALGCTQPPMINPVVDSPAAQVASVIFNPKEYSLFMEWQQALFCSGLPPETNERPCTLTYLGPDGSTLFTTSFISTGLFKITPNTDAAGEVVSYTALLYVRGGASFEAADQAP